ncbi:MAG: thioredoxin domain-containing protein [Deltaproteobacteria bacterium]|nr:thioredoxin domain-containing protein [Deltaproteobacteria bacterium]
MSKILLLLLLLLNIIVAGTAAAGEKSCDDLTGSKKEIALKLLNQIKSYDCCDESVFNCINKKNPCDVSIRLAKSICSKVAKGESEKKIINRIKYRAKSMNPLVKKTSIDLSSTPVAGDEKASVSVVVYACTRCPFCANLVPQIYKEVTNGERKGKVKLYFKPFPLKSHEFSKEGGLALIAANSQGKFWPFLLRLYSEFDFFSLDKLTKWATLEGMNKSDFAKKMSEPSTRNQLIASKKEGLANGVTSTPQLFINGKKYVGFLDMPELVDVLTEEYVRVH